MNEVMESQQIPITERKVERARLVPSWRLGVSLICGLGAFAVTFARVKTNFAVICMVQDLPTPELTPGDGNSSVGAPPSTHTRGEFQWSKQFQGLVLSAYFYGYVPALAIGGWLADRFPSHRVVIVSAVGQAVAAALIPQMTRLHPLAIIALRALQGIMASAIYPAFNVIVGKWSLKGEFPLLFSIYWSFGYLGIVACFPISSVFCQSSFLDGWPAIFYLSALILVVWAALAALVITESPEDHRFVSSAERLCLQPQTNVQPKALSRPEPVLICSLLGNLQVWIICLSFLGTRWFFTSLNITLPMFLKEGLGFHITENGFMSILPSIVMATMTILGGKSFEYLHFKKDISATNARKILSLIGLLVPSALMTAVFLLPASQRYLSVILISAAQGFSSIAISSGPVSAANEIAPQYTGLIWGIASSIGNTSGFLAPVIATAMTPNGTLQEWCRFFAIAIVLMVLLSVLIGFFWKSEIQPFAEHAEENPASKVDQNVQTNVPSER